jgi:hypothetical protein
MRGDKGEASEDTNVLTGLGECGTCCALGTDHDDAAGTKMPDGCVLESSVPVCSQCERC